VRWELVAGFVAVGTGTLVLGGFFAYGRFGLAADLSAFWSGFCVNVGTSLVLAAALIWFERVIIRRVRKEAREVADAAATRAADLASGRIQEAIDKLDAEWRKRIVEQESDVGVGAQRVATGDFEGVRKELVTAGAISAIARVDHWTQSSSQSYVHSASGGGRISVRAGESADSPLFSFRYDPNSRVSPDAIVVRFVGEAGRSPTYCETEWRPGEPFVDAAFRLRDEMVEAGYAEDASRLEPRPLLDRLGRVLSEAQRSRRNSAGNVVYEAVTPDCLITDKGIEVAGFGIALERPWVSPSEAARFSISGPHPPKMDPATWNVALERAGAVYRAEAVRRPD
jgi:hypothetical protein